jgi:SET domain-containing protein
MSEQHGNPPQQQQQFPVGGYREWRVASMLQRNCAFVPVLHAGAQQLYLAVVATADIAAGEELMLDYGPEYWEAKLGEWNEAEMAAQLQQVRRSCQMHAVCVCCCAKQAVLHV